MEKTLHDRLHALGQKIETAEARLRAASHLKNHGAHLTAQELRERYRHLQERLNGEAAGHDAHDDRVADLERSVHQWVDSFDTTHVASN